MQNIRIQQYKVLDQNNQNYQKLTKKQGITSSICGYIVCSLTFYIGNSDKSIQKIIKQINQVNTSQQLKKVISFVRYNRLKYTKQHNFTKQDQQYYLKDWVANYQIQDYLNQNFSRINNKNVYFFRNVSFNYPEAIQNIKHQELERIQFQKQFIGQKYFVTKFPTKHITVSQFQSELSKLDLNKPIIIIVDTLGHFTTIIYYNHKMYILDSNLFTQYKDNDVCLDLYDILKNIMSVNKHISK